MFKNKIYYRLVFSTHLKNIKIKVKIFPSRGEHEKYLKPPSRYDITLPHGKQNWFSSN